LSKIVAKEFTPTEVSDAFLVVIEWLKPNKPIEVENEFTDKRVKEIISMIYSDKG